MSVSGVGSMDWLGPQMSNRLEERESPGNVRFKQPGLCEI